MAERMAGLTSRAAGYEDAVTVVVLVLAVVAFAALAWVDGMTWWTLRGTRDRTAVGRRLKRKKLGWAVIAAGLAVLYLTTLLDELDWYETGVVWRLVIRLVTVTAVVATAVIGVRFYRAYRREIRRTARGDPAREV